MASQLIYTSARQGLAAGQSGFCTVARDAELRETLARTLEQLSSFHHSAAVGRRDPVISAYRVLELRGAKYHVLSRIQDVGLDFTERTNNLAHHLIFDPHELGDLPSPALIFRDWNGWREEWNGPPRFLGPQDWGNLAQLPRAISLPARNWHNLTGDAGSAAGLLERQFANGAYLLADSPEMLLPLLAESVQLLALRDKSRTAAWEYTFTSRLQPEDNPHDFRWRGCQQDSPAYQVALRKGATFTAIRSIKAPSNDLAQYARTGKLPAPEKSFRTLPEPRISLPTPRDESSTVAVPVPSIGLNRDQVHFEAEDDARELKGRPQFRWLPWMSFLVMLIVLFGLWAWSRSRSPQTTQSGKATNEGASSNSIVIANNSPITNSITGSTAPLTVTTNPTQGSLPSMGVRWVDRLPNFMTYLVPVSSPSGIIVSKIADLSTVSGLLKQQTSIRAVTNILECRIVTDNALSTNTSPDKLDFSHSSLPNNEIRGTNPAGLGFALKDWSHLEPPKGQVAAMDFRSLHGEFTKFRVVAFPAGATNQPLKFPKSLLQVNQSDLSASLAESLASRISKFEAREGFLQLRPFIKTNGVVKDMIESLPPESKCAPPFGNELNFDLIRKRLNDEIKQASEQTNQVQQKIASFEEDIKQKQAEINSKQLEYKKAPDEQQQANIQDDINSKKRNLDDSMKRRGAEERTKNSLAQRLTNCRSLLAVIPENLDDPILDHVGLFFVTGDPLHPGERIELIRFEDAAGASEGRK